MCIHYLVRSQVNTEPISFKQNLRMTSEETQIPEELKGCYENLIVIDIGANLTNKKYGRDLDSVIQRAKDAGACQCCIREERLA